MCVCVSRFSRFENAGEQFTLLTAALLSYWYKSIFNFAGIFSLTFSNYYKWPRCSSLRQIKHTKVLTECRKTSLKYLYYSQYPNMFVYVPTNVSAVCIWFITLVILFLDDFRSDHSACIEWQ